MIFPHCNPPSWLVVFVLEKGGIITHAHYYTAWDMWLIHFVNAQEQCAVACVGKEGNTIVGFSPEAQAVSSLLDSYSTFVHSSLVMQA